MVYFFCLLVMYAGSGSANDRLAHASTEEKALVQKLENVEELRYQGRYQEGMEVVEQALKEAAALQSPQLEVEAIYQLSLLYYYQHDYAQARAELEVGLARSRVHELEWLEADFLAAQGVLEWKQGNLHLALPKLEAAMRIREQRGNFASMSSISNNIGIIHFTLKNYREAEAYYLKALELLDNEDSQRLRSSLYINLSEVLIPMDRLDEAEAYLVEALEIEQSVQDPQSLAYIHFNLGELAIRRNNPAQALEKFGKAKEIQERIGDKWAIALTLLKVSSALIDQNNPEQAILQAQEGYSIAQELNALSLLRDYCAHFMRIYRQSGDTGRAQYFSEQHDWFDERVSLESTTEQPVDEPIPVSGEPIAKENAQLLPFQTIMITLLGAMILILIFENTRLRVRINKL